MKKLFYYSDDFGLSESETEALIKNVVLSLVQLRRSLSRDEVLFILNRYAKIEKHNDILTYCSTIGMNITALSRFIKKDALLTPVEETLFRKSFNFGVDIPSALMMRYSMDYINYDTETGKVEILPSTPPEPPLNH